MKVLILTNKVGGGHNSTAKALKKEFEKYKDTQCRIIDSFEYISPIIQKKIADGYVFYTKIFPHLYAKQYRHQEIRDIKETKDAGETVLHKLLGQKLLTYFEKEFYPDLVISTHIFSAEFMNLLLEKKQIDVVSVGIITDFTIHPHWCRLSCTDYFVTASELLTHQARKKGIEKGKILPFGIPIDEKFNIQMEKETARAILDIEDKKTILFMSGSMGYGNLEKMVREIDAIQGDFQILVVCGSNKKNQESILQEKEDGVFRHSIQIFGFVNNVDILMSAADVVITKPGGLTTCEVLAKRVPMIMVNPIPGQEDRNVEFLTNNGCAFFSTETFPIDEAFYQLFYMEEKLENMRKNIDLIRKPHATKEICDFFIKKMKK